MKDILSSHEQKMAYAGLIAMLITAFFSVGYFHADEHFQILEFIHYKLGHTPVQDLPWEFGEKMRPAIQVALGYGLIRILNGFGIEDPFLLVFFLRLISGFLTWQLWYKLAQLLLPDFKVGTGQKTFLGMCFLLWFVPLIGVRYSSENWSALAFFSGLYLILRSELQPKSDGHSQMLLAGIMLGFSFYFRFQIGFAIAGLCMWLLFMQRFSIPKFLLMGISMCLAFSVSTAADYWLYGEFVCTPCNYFRANIIENKAANFGVSPWWNYFKLFIYKGMPPLSILLLIAFLIGLYRKPKSVFTWCMVPFIIGHSCVGHKELRFMFPMAVAFVYLSATGIIQLWSWISSGRLRSTLAVLMISVNLLLLAGVAFSPAQPVVKLYKFLYHHGKHHKMTLLCKEKSPYDIRSLNVHFYRSEHLDCKVFKDEHELKAFMDVQSPDSVYILERGLHLKDSFGSYSSEKIYSSFPGWIEKFNVNNWLARTNVWSVYKLKRKVQGAPDEVQFKK